MMQRSPFHRARGSLRVAKAADEAEIMLYDEISLWGVTAETFKRELDAIDSPVINLRLNSPGGDVFDSLAIYNALREHPAKIITHIDGLAASMASVIALAGDEVRMAENAFFMVHNPWAMVIGNADDLRKEADLLDKVAGSLVMAYTQKSGQSEDEITALMNEETWLNAEEAHEAGFVDEVVGEAKEKASFDLSIYANVPDALKGAEHDPTIRELERALRDAGLSQAAAKAYVAAGREAASQRDADEAGERDVTPEPGPILIGF